MEVNKNVQNGKIQPNLIGKYENETQINKPKIIQGVFDNSENGVNEKIDEGVFQGKTGDCWLLSGIMSLSYTEDGAKLIEDAITKNDDGSYSVYFQGADKTYTVTEDELKDANKNSLLSKLGLEKSKYSKGDDDMLLIELATEKLINEGEVPIETRSGLNGGSAYYLYQIFTDNAVGYSNGEDDKSVKTLLNYYETYQDSSAGTLGVLDGFAGLEDNHAYAIKSYKDGVMTVVNPWDTTEDIEITEKDLLSNLGDYDISVMDNELEEDMSWEEENCA